MLANGQQLTATVRSAISILDAASARGAPDAAATPAPSTLPLENPTERPQAPSPNRPRSSDAHRWSSRSRSPTR
eukprot:14714411-Heterocapsa_arctica.AAC.1